MDKKAEVEFMLEELAFIGKRLAKMSRELTRHQTSEKRALERKIKNKNINLDARDNSKQSPPGATCA